MSLPYSSVVAVSGIVQTPAFSTEKQHMLLAIANNPLMPSTIPFLEFTSALSFATYFGREIKEYKQVNKYFNFLSKTGLAPQKVVIANWYKESAQAFYKGSSITTSITDLKNINNGSFKITMNNNEFEVVIDMSSINSYSDVATLIQTQLRTNADGGASYTEATVSYNTISKGLIITNGAEAGTSAIISTITQGETGTDISSLLGLSSAILSQGVNAETWTKFCDRIYNANSTGFSITTLENLSNQDYEDSISWLQTVKDGQTYNTAVKLVFDFRDGNMTSLSDLVNTLNSLNFTGYSICYDPHEEYVNMICCAICGSTDYEQPNSTKNFNFQPANGYTPITNYGSVVDYQAGNTNSQLAETLNALKVNYIYSIGAGNNEVVYYGQGLMPGSFATEGTQANEAWFEKALQISIMNAFDTLEKIQLRGTKSRDTFNGLINSVIEKAKSNGTIADEGTLSDTDKLSIIQTTNNPSAVDCVEANGVYFQIQPLTQEDINARRIRIIICYLVAGEVNFVRIINNIYGA